MDTPAGKYAFRTMLEEALAKCFPGMHTEVEFAGVTEHDVMWLVTVGQVVRTLTQRETTVLLRGHANEFQRYFSDISSLNTEKDHGEGKI